MESDIVQQNLSLSLGSSLNTKRSTKRETELRREEGARGDENESDGCGWNSRPEISLLSSTRTVSGQGHCGGLLRDVTSFFLSFFMYFNTQQSPQRADLSTTHEGNIGAATLNALLHFVLSLLVSHYRLLSTYFVRLFFFSTMHSSCSVFC